MTVAELPSNGGVVSSVNYANIAAASLQALHANAWHTSDAYLAKRSEQLLAAVRANSDPNASEASRDAVEGEFLNLAAAKYSRHVVDATRQVGGLFGESGTTGISLGLTSAQVKVNYLFDLPYGLFRKGFLIDWPGSISPAVGSTALPATGGPSSSPVSPVPPTRPTSGRRTPTSTPSPPPAACSSPRSRASRSCRSTTAATGRLRKRSSPATPTAR
ncbi:hypothetical protein [Thauera sinica]|uniref:hypothetical protein n=1 Tax=Thauera sp. K11 TaxID=2005884 RepID=UPI0012FD854A|nr:hypothetical protein [Thauera sp. K11]